MTVEQLLATFGAQIGVPAAALDSAGRCRLTFDSTIHVDLEHDKVADRLQVYTVLGPVPPDGQAALFRRMLAANLFGTETGGACFALDELNNDMLLFTTVDVAAADASGLAAAVANLVSRTEAWQADQRPAEGAVAVAPAATASPEAFHASAYMIRG